MNDGTTISGEKERANAHPAGDRPFQREHYVKKFDTLVEPMIPKIERDRFIHLAERLPQLSPEEVLGLNVQVPTNILEHNTRDEQGIF